MANGMPDCANFKIKGLDVVDLVRDLPEVKLLQGRVGTVVGKNRGKTGTDHV
jgi:hypothetical protein